MADLSKLRFNGTDYNVKDASAPLRKFTNYSKTGNLPITSNDTTQTAIGKLEKALDSKINTSAKGTASGVAELDANGKVPSSQLPSYVDDVLEYSAKRSFPATGETGKIYVDTTTNKTYRWSGSAYVEISESLALGETSSTAYRGDRGKAAYDHSQITNGNPHGTTGANTNLTGYSKGSSKDAVAATDTVNAAIAKHENRINANQTNILYTLNTGVKNLIVCNEKKAVAYGLTITRTQDGIQISGTATASFSLTITGNVLVEETQDPYDYSVFSKLPDSVILTGAPDSVEQNRIIVALYNDQTWIYSFSSLYDMPQDLSNYNYNCWYAYIPIVKNKTYSGIWKPMLRDASISDDTFVPGALPNYDLTYLQAEDRAALAEVVDSGAKNLVDLSNTGTGTHNTVTFTNLGNNRYKINGTPSASDTHLDIMGTWSSVPSFLSNNVGKTIVFATNHDHIYYGIIPIVGGSALEYVGGNKTTPVSYTIPSNLSGALLRIYVDTTQTYNNVTAELLACTKAAFGVSSKFVPYRPNWDLVYDACNLIELSLSDFITMKSGYTLNTRNGASSIWKQGKHIFGYLCIDYNSDFSDNIVGNITVAYAPKYQINALCNLGKDRWSSSGYGIYFISSAMEAEVSNRGTLQIRITEKSTAEDANVAYMHIDYIIA